MTFFDSHCHLTDERFAGEVDAVLERAGEHGVERVVTIASDADDATRAIELAGRFDGVSATAGVHPHEAGHGDAAALDRVAELASRPEVVAIGETGLDYYYDNAPRERQCRTFRAQLELGAEYDLPVIVHAREADADTATLIREFAGDARGVLHCFAGGSELLDAGLAAGWYVSFSGLVTFKSYDGADHVRAVPADRLLVETDSPYLAPVPRRGRRNEPAFVRHVAERVAELRGASVDEVARQTTRNSCALYGIPTP